MDGKNKIKAVLIVGARPNFMKAAPLLRAMEKSGQFDPILVHTGQHYDSLMSDVFFRDLDLPQPQSFFGIGSGTHAQQTAKIMLASEAYFSEAKKLDVVVVVGDVNSTLAAALTAKKLGIPVAHVEAGLRSFDEAMPEEINRRLTDHISDFLFTTEASANKNLQNEGINAGKIHFVGNVMIDSLLYNLSKIKKSAIGETLGLKGKNYAVFTLHRPSNVDNKQSFTKIFSALKEVQAAMPVVFPVHPRTKKQMKELGFGEYFAALKNLLTIEPLGYVDFMKLVSDAKLIMTDSGGLQEEATVLGVPCLTLRETTERPATVEIGTNVITGTDPKKIVDEAKKIINGGAKKGGVPEKWDGQAAERIVNVLIEARN